MALFLLGFKETKRVKPSLSSQKVSAVDCLLSSDLGEQYISENVELLQL